jgi:hypothetical protein
MENCFFYISRTYEFLHRLGQQRRKRSERFVGLCPQHPQKLTKFKPWRRRMIGAADYSEPKTRRRSLEALDEIDQRLAVRLMLRHKLWQHASKTV